MNGWMPPKLRNTAICWTTLTTFECSWRKKDHIYRHLTHASPWMLPRTLFFIFFRQYFWMAKLLAYKKTTLERDFDSLLDVMWWLVGASIQKSFHLSQVAVLNLMWKTAKERHICSYKRCASKDINRKSDVAINGLNATYFFCFKCYSCFLSTLVIEV